MSTILCDVGPTRGGFSMGTARISVIAKLSPAVIAVLVLLFCVGTAGAAAPVNERLAKANRIDREKDTTDAVPVGHHIRKRLVGFLSI
jgi:hypothetical protein